METGAPAVEMTVVNPIVVERDSRLRMITSKRERGGAAAHTSRRERENSGDKRERVCVCERGEERRTSVNIEREEYSAQYDRLVCVGV